MEWLPVLIGVLAGLAVGFLAGRALARGAARAEAAEARAAAERTRADEVAAVERRRADDLAALERTHHEAVAQVRGDLSAARAELETWKRAAVERREEHEAMRKQLEASFDALAGKALDANQSRLLEQTGLKLKPFEDQLKELQKATQELEKKRERAYGTLDEQLRHLHQSTSSLQSQSDKLATALRGSSQARGRWGEATLRRLAEMAQMVEHCDFAEQLTTEDGGRPDMVVMLPGKGAIPIDAKVPMAAYQDALAAEDDAVRSSKLKQHAADVRGHVRTLKDRDYGAKMAQSVDFTVMFLPSESLLAVALSEFPDLFDEALNARVLLATPVTLLALLRTVRMNWDHVQVEENAREIQRVAVDLFRRFVKWGDHFQKTGKALDGATKAYNDAVGSFSSRVLPAGRRLSELRVGDADGLPSAARIERQVRDLPPPEPRDLGADDEDAGDAEAEA